MLEVAVTGGLRDGAKLGGRAAAPRACGLNVLPAFRCCARSGYVPSVPGFPPLDLSPWRSVWNPQAWREFLAETVPTEQTVAIRQSTHTGRPLGSPGFVRTLEITLRRRLTPEKGGRPPKEGLSLAQQAFSFGQD